MEDNKKRSSNKKKSKSFWDDGLSIDETKISSLIICLLAGMMYVGVAYTMNGDISSNLADIIMALIYAVASINVAGSLDKLMNSRNDMKMKQMQYEHELEMKELDTTTKTSDDYIDI